MYTKTKSVSKNKNMARIIRNRYRSLEFEVYNMKFIVGKLMGHLPSFGGNRIYSFTTNTLNDPGTIFLLALATAPDSAGSISAEGKNKV